MQSSLPRPAYDPELAAGLAGFGLPSTIEPGMIEAFRAAGGTDVEALLAGRDIVHERRSFPGPGSELEVSIFRPKNINATAPGFYYLHSGGMILGDRFLGIRPVLDWVEQFSAVAVTIEYRLAPEHPDPAPIDDSYAGLLWVNERATELGIDRDRLIIVGSSAGGGLAAGVALLARDRGGPTVLGQVLMYPMIDDRNDTTSSRQYVNEGPWDRGANDTAWNSLLGDRRGTADVSIYAAPARADDLTGLPPCFIDVGAAEVFRDEDVALASKLWAAGVQTELHVWPGAYHAFDFLLPDAAISVVATKSRTAWVERLLRG